MFTIKLYKDDTPALAARRILSAESFSVICTEGAVEITLHGLMQDGERTDRRYDLSYSPAPEGWPQRYARAIIENAQGRTTEMLYAPPLMGQQPVLAA